MGQLLAKKFSMLISPLLLLLVQCTAAASYDARNGGSFEVKDYHTFNGSATAATSCGAPRGDNHREKDCRHSDRFSTVDLDEPDNSASFLDRSWRLQKRSHGSLDADQRCSYGTKLAMSLLADLAGFVLLFLTYDYVSCESQMEIQKCPTSVYGVFFSLITLVSSVLTFTLIGEVHLLHGDGPVLTTFARFAIGKLVFSFVFLLCFVLLAHYDYSMADLDVLLKISCAIALFTGVGFGVLGVTRSSTSPSLFDDL